MAFLLLFSINNAFCRYRVGEVYIQVSKDEAQSLLEKEEERLKTAIAATADKLTEVNKTLADLKTKLYAKFGASINLEED